MVPFPAIVLGLRWWVRWAHAGCQSSSRPARGAWGPASAADGGGWLITHHTPTPAHAPLYPRAAGARDGQWGAALAAPMAVLVVWQGWGGAGADGLVLHQGGAAAFGGAYAVLPYVYQGRWNTTDGSAARR